MYLVMWRDLTAEDNQSTIVDMLNDQQLDNMMHYEAGGCCQLVDWREVDPNYRVLRIIVAGSRSFNDYSLLKQRMDFYIQGNPNIVIVSGTARGADQFGERYAQERGYYIAQYKPDWSIGKQAGYLRNAEMAQNADCLVAFWDQKSRGTKHMIDLAYRHNLMVRVVNY